MQYMHCGWSTDAAIRATIQSNLDRTKSQGTGLRYRGLLNRGFTVPYAHDESFLLSCRSYDNYD